MCEGWFEKGRCTLPIEVECWCESDCCWVEVNLATLTCWGYYQILDSIMLGCLCYFYCDVGIVMRREWTVLLSGDTPK